MVDKLNVVYISAIEVMKRNDSQICMSVNVGCQYLPV